jgi:hypothetical protein
LRITPLRAETSLGRFRAPVSTYCPDCRDTITHTDAGARNIIPARVAEQFVEFYYAAVQFDDGARREAWVLLPDEPYHSAFLAAQARRRQMGR